VASRNTVFCSQIDLITNNRLEQLTPANVVDIVAAWLDTINSKSKLHLKLNVQPMVYPYDSLITNLTSLQNVVNVHLRNGKRISLNTAYRQCIELEIR
jgi:hypothetical protein